MDQQTFRRLETLFAEAAALPETERDAFVRERCADDPLLEEKLAGMLKRDAAGTRSVMSALQVDDGSPAAAQRIGPYVVRRILGRGGMGAVCLATRADDAFDKTVAIKVVRDRLSPELVARFRTERQILAGLEHPNVARLLDGGEMDDGYPYVVMEFVDGIPLDEYCDRHRLGIPERLELFCAVCDAARYIHRNLVVHRDIKPTNILVTPDGTPKLLDFGIARLVDTASGEKPAPATQTVHRMLTPSYASPEQIRGDLVSTATDIYSLGVLLYELLTGRTPFPSVDSDFLTAARAVCEQEPEQPSTMVRRAALARSASTSCGMDEIARRRGTTSKRLSRSLAGDLDAIVLNALRKEPERRYASVEALEQDLHRHRDALPIAARPDSLRYRARKLVARHALPVAGSIFLVLVLAGGVAATSWQANIAAVERAEAEAALATSNTVQRFLRSMLIAADPREGGQSVTMRQAMDRAAARVDAELVDEPAVEARVREVIGMTYRTLGVYQEADVHLTRANELAQAAFGTSADAARIEHELAVLRWDQGRNEEALALARHALAMQEMLLGPLHDGTLETRLLIARIRQQGDPEAALPEARAVVDGRRATLPAGDPRTVEAENTLGKVLISLDRHAEATSLLRSVYEAQLTILGERHPDTLITANDLGMALSGAGELAEALEWQTRAMEGLEEQFPGGSIDVVIPRINVARLHRRLEQPAAASALARAALADGVPALRDDHYVIAVARLVLGRSLADLGETDQSRVMLERAHAVLLDRFGPEHTYTRQAADAMAALSE